MVKPPPFGPFPPMPKAFSDLQEKVSELMRSSPAGDVEKHMKTALASALQRMDVVTRQDFDVQSEVLARALEKLSVLEKRIAELEQSGSGRR